VVWAGRRVHGIDARLSRFAQQLHSCAKSIGFFRRLAITNTAVRMSMESEVTLTTIFSCVKKPPKMQGRCKVFRKTKSLSEAEAILPSRSSFPISALTIELFATEPKLLAGPSVLEE